MKILIIYPPFCTPAMPPYSVTYLSSFLKNNCDHEIKSLDLNLEFHKQKFTEYQKYYQQEKWEDYEQKTNEYHQLTKKVYSQNNKKVVQGKKPELFEEILTKIKKEKPDIVAFSLVYSSQAFYTHALLKELKDVKTIIGGPAVNEKLILLADKHLSNEVELLDQIQKTKHEDLKLNFALDFSKYNLKEYFIPKTVIPIKTSTTCPYKGCTFCTHFTDKPYIEFSTEMITKTIKESKEKYFFLIDDLIPTKRLLELAKIFKPLKINWTCQLRPTKDLTLEVLKELKESGLSMIIFGVESGTDRILKLINKGTNTKDIQQVLTDSHKAGIKNITYIIFGFPTETKEELIQTINFLEDNSENIDLISTSIFGLQKRTKIYNNPEEFGIKNIQEKERTVLEPKISYETKTGLTQQEAKKLRDNYKKTIEKINKYPQTMNFFREHMFCSI